MIKPRAERLANLLLLCASLAVGVLIVEGYLRWARLDYPLLWTPDQRLGWRSIPNATRYWTEEGHAFVRMNSLGYRDRERSLQKPASSFRIAVFGDSMTQAVQVELEQTYSYLLEEKLRARRSSVEVLNFGVNGYSPIQELLLFKEEGPRYKPDLVILAAFLDNDVSGVHPRLGVANDAGPPFSTVDGDGLRFDFSRSEQSHSDYHREPFHLLRQYSAVYRTLSEYRWRQAATVTMNPEQRSIPRRYDLYRSSVESVWEDAWRIFDRIVLEFAAESNRQGIPLLLLSVPAPQVATHSAWPEIVAGIPAMSQIAWHLKGPEQRLAAFAAAQGLQLIQPYEVFRSSGDEPPMFFGNVGHMTARGHAILAEALARALPESVIKR